MDESVEMTFSSTSTLEASDPSPNSPPSGAASDFGIEKESTPPQPDKLQSHRGRGRPRRQAFHMPQEVLGTESKRKLRTRKNAEVAVEDLWTNLSKAPLLTPLSPKKPRQARALQKPQTPVNWTPLPLYAFH